MKTLRSPVSILIALCLAFSAFLLGTVPLLPRQVASHFGNTGQANGWMSRSEHLIFIGGLGIGLSFFIALIAWIIGIIPARYFNLPHRDYWLSPEHEKSTRMFISTQLIWLACLELLFFAGIQWLMIQANRNIPAVLPSGMFFLMLGLFLVVVACGTVRFTLRFVRQPTQSIQRTTE